MTITCPHCFYDNPDGALVCEQCYAALDDLLHCGNCGTRVPNQATFCSHCGFPLSLNPNAMAATKPLMTDPGSASPTQREGHGAPSFHGLAQGQRADREGEGPRRAGAG
ncbi:MAG: zinc ribbon domain-containing protein [Prochlorothrix sp.]|nr:zinc ribbon domain-containing protein [Prochlorothrix sp.]